MNEKSISISVFEDIFTAGDCTFDPILISNDREIIITYMLVCPSGRVTWMFHILIKESRKYQCYRMIEFRASSWCKY